LRKSLYARSSLDHLIRPLEERWWKHQADGLRCLQVHSEFQLHRSLDWKIRWTLAFQDAIEHEEPIDPVSHHLRESALELLRGGNGEEFRLEFQSARRTRRFGEIRFASRSRWVLEERDGGEHRHNLLEKFEAFGAQFTSIEHEPGDVPAGSGKGGSPTKDDKIGGRDGDDWNARRQPHDFRHDRWTPCHDDPTPEPNQIRGKFAIPVGAPGRITRLDEDVSVGFIAMFSQAGEEARVWLIVPGGVGQIPDSREVSGLLRLGGERRGEEAARQSSLGMSVGPSRSAPRMTADLGGTGRDGQRVELTPTGGRADYDLSFGSQPRSPSR
jgi:hypothetical protein